jgi:hypothetical protein
MYGHGEEGTTTTDDVFSTYLLDQWPYIHTSRAMMILSHVVATILELILCWAT